mmetsp:Transcript_12950/g.40876  ORF Transcript_12950/g.40876 Transcript_12950/m.40876 type:complete len:204 (+) Transcript_12950:412-1023(+)
MGRLKRLRSARVAWPSSKWRRRSTVARRSRTSFMNVSMAVYDFANWSGTPDRKDTAALVMRDDDTSGHTALPRKLKGVRYAAFTCSSGAHVGPCTKVRSASRVVMSESGESTDCPPYASSTAGATTTSRYSASASLARSTATYERSSCFINGPWSSAPSPPRTLVSKERQRRVSDCSNVSSTRRSRAPIARPNGRCSTCPRQN